MAEPALKRRLTPEEYLAFERSCLEEKHEYIDGEVVAMSGGTFAHSVISGNVLTSLNLALRGRGCFVCSADMRVKVPASERYTYPDAAVVCGEPELEDSVRDTLLNPVLLVEVLSSSTESYDRGDEFAHYRTLPSLVDYVLISQQQVLVEHFHRRDDGTWLLTVLGPGEELALPALGAAIPVDGIYLGLFPEEAGREAGGEA